MPLIRIDAEKNLASLVEHDPWQFLAEADCVHSSGDIVVSSARLLAQSEALLAHNGRIGVILQPTDGPQALVPFLPRLDLIVVNFPAFRDGRGFSSAALLRQRFHYRGELRATGDFLRDQIFFLLRVGFDAFDCREADSLSAFERAASSFSSVYQSSSDQRLPAFIRRADPFDRP